MRKDVRTLTPSEQFLAAWRTPAAVVAASLHSGVDGPDDDGLAWALDPLAALARDVEWTVVFDRLPDRRAVTCIFERATLCINDKLSPTRQAMAIIYAEALLLLQCDVAYRELALSYTEEAAAVSAVAYVVPASLGVNLRHERLPAPRWRSEHGGAITVARIAAAVDRTAKRIEASVLRDSEAIHPNR